MIETEIKVKINNLGELREKIYNLKGIYKLSLEHEDTYFNMPEGLRDFQNTDEALRVRSSIEFSDKGKNTPINIQTIITYKGKKLDKLTKTRKEIEVKVDDKEKMKEILLGLGFREILTVVKKRDLYEIPFEGELIEVLIDYVPDLESYFMELELIVDPSEVQKAQRVLFGLLYLLGYKKEDSIRKSYLELIIEKL